MEKILFWETPVGIYCIIIKVLNLDWIYDTYVFTITDVTKLKLSLNISVYKNSYFLNIDHLEHIA